MRILVCGATGYLGRHIARAVAAAGHEMRVLARSEESAAKLSDLGYHAVRGDLSDIAAVLPLFDGVDAIVCAAQLMIEDEQAAARTMLQSIEGSGKTFILTTGTGLLSQRTDGRWSEDSFAEDDAFVPSKYIGARHETELMVRSFAGRGVRAMVVRPPLLWGNGECKVIEDFYRSAALTGSVCYLGAGLNLYSNVHVEDLANLYVLALERGVAGALYHAVSGEENYRAIAEAVARTLGVPTRSVDFAEAERIWDRFTALIAFSVCSRSRSPRSRAELGWAPDPARLDILEEAVDPRFAAGMNTDYRPPASARR